MKWCPSFLFHTLKLSLNELSGGLGFNQRNSRKAILRTRAVL